MKKYLYRLQENCFKISRNLKNCIYCIGLYQKENQAKLPKRKIICARIGKYVRVGKHHF